MRKQLTLAAAMVVFFSAAVARADMKIMLKGGVGVFTGDLSNATSAGPAWGVVMNFQPLGLVGLEFAYEGSRNGLSDRTAPLSSGLLRNGASGMLKVSPLPLPILNPFVAGGVGGSYMIIQNQETPLHYQNGFMLELPLAAGVEINLPVLTVGARATFHWFLTQRFVIPTDQNHGNLFDVTATVGLRY